MSETIKNQGGVLVRLMEAINGFRTKHGRWPSKVQVDETTIAHLATVSLTPLGLFLLQSRLELAIGEPDRILALGDEGEVFDYGEEGWQRANGQGHDAMQWLVLGE